jgi:hypothetical protein
MAGIFSSALSVVAGASQVAQGTLNRVRTHIVVPSYPFLNVSAAYMGKSLAALTFDDPFVDQESTATGVVNSPRPFVMSTLTISLLRTQSLAAAWIAQAQTHSVLGSIDTYPDSAAFPVVTLANCSIIGIDPGAFDGQDPVVKTTIKGVFYANATLWSPTNG